MMKKELLSPEDVERINARKRMVGQPRALTLRWARSQRYAIRNPKYRFIFDVESTPDYYGESIGEKVKAANEKRRLSMKEAKDGGRDADWGDLGEITEHEYRRFLIFLEKTPNMQWARTLRFLHAYKDAKIIEHIFTAEKKAIESGNADQLLAIHKYIDKFMKDAVDILGLREKYYGRRKNQERKQEGDFLEPLTVVDAEGKKIA